MNRKDSSKKKEIKQESKEEVKQEDKEEENSRKRKHGTRKKMKLRKRRFKQDTSQDDPSDTDKENVYVCMRVFSLRLMMLGEVDRETLGLACGVLLICSFDLDLCSAG
ncbi:hypothetical protein Tco_1183300 [Tanacetum coccineum]